MRLIQVVVGFLVLLIAGSACVLWGLSRLGEQVVFSPTAEDLFETPLATAPLGSATLVVSSGGGPGIPLLNGQSQMTASGLRYIDEKVGDGASPQTDQEVTIHYTAWLTDATKVDSSRDRAQPLVFRLGDSQVIAGLAEGVATMRVGGKRRLIVPPDLGYGARGSAEGIPPNSILIFDVELLNVQ